MPASRFAYVCLCALTVAAAFCVAPAVAESVQTTFTADANTTALYLFKEGTGTTTVHETVLTSPQPPNATLSGATWAVGRNNYAVATAAGYVSIADSSALRPTSAITVEVWVKLNQPGGDLVCKNGAYLMRLGSTITAEFEIAGGWRAVHGSLPVPVGQWTHLAMTYSSTTHVASIYVNGVLDTATTFTGLSSWTLAAGTATTRLGQNDWASMGSEVDGKIDSYRISKIARAFTPLYPSSAGATTAPGNLVPNGDFEMGMAGWRGNDYGDATLSWETTGGAASGQKCLHALSNRTLGVGLYSRPIPAHPGRKYSLSMRLKTSSGNLSPRIEVDLLGANITTVSGFPVYPTATTSWQQFAPSSSGCSAFSFTLPANLTAPMMCIYISEPSGAELYVDDVRLVAGDDPNVLTLKDKLSAGPAAALPVGNVYVAGVASPTAMNIVNTDTVAHDVTVQPTITDWEGNRVSGVPSLGTFTVPAAGVKTATYNVDTGRRGSFRLGFDFTSEGQTWHQLGEVQYVVVVNLQNVGNPDTSYFAMNTHMEREPSDHFAHELQVLSQCGVKWIRAWWGWGMCEQTQGTFDFTEYDRQYNAVAGANLRIMPILLRYYNSGYGFQEQSWAGPTTSGAIQEYPYANMVPEFGVWAGKVAQHFAGNIKAYEIWNEPTMGTSPNGVLTPAQYAALLNAATPAIRAGDPNTKVVAFAGVPTSFVTATLALGTASQMDIVSDHGYAQNMLPEKNYPIQMAADKSAISGGGVGGKPIWHTEQGIVGDDDGYTLPSVSEQDVAQLYVRDVVTAASQGGMRFFWFSADVTPTYGFADFFGNYVPRPRLTALNACASFIDGMTYQKSYTPSGTNTYAHFFKGAGTATCVVWNSAAGMTLTLGIAPGKIQVFDTMGNALTVGSANGGASSTIQISAERPAYIQCAVADYSALDTALTGMQVAVLSPISVVATPVVGGVQVTLTGTSQAPVDAIASLLPAASKTPTGWPTAQRFQALALGQSITLRFVVPNKAGVKSVQLIVGNRQLSTFAYPYAGH